MHTSRCPGLTDTRARAWYTVAFLFTLVQASHTAGPFHTVAGPFHTVADPKHTVAGLNAHCSFFHGCSPPHIRFQNTEAIYIKELPALRALFECYADGGGEHQGTRALGLAATHCLPAYTH